jgi:hypothetical protein
VKAKHAMSAQFRRYGIWRRNQAVIRVLPVFVDGKSTSLPGCGIVLRQCIDKRLFSCKSYVKPGQSPFIDQQRRPADDVTHLLQEDNS